MEADSSSGPSSSPTGSASPRSAQEPTLTARRPRRWVPIVAVVIVLAVVGGGLYAYVNRPVSGASCPAKKLPAGTQVLYVLVECEATTAMSGDSFKAFLLVPISDHMTVLGQFTSNGSVGSYIVNSSEISVLESNPHPSGPPASYYWTGGVSATGNISIQIPPAPGQYYMVFENLNSEGLSLLWTAPLQVVDLGNG